jgi:hypothetical protein
MNGPGDVDWEMEALLSMDGEIGDAGDGLWFKIEAERVGKDDHRPHGIKYSLTLHDKTGQRIFGIDNAHSIGKPRRGPGYRRITAWGHLHEGKRKKRYEYRTACDLLKDFFDAIEAEKKRRRGRT